MLYKKFQCINDRNLFLTFSLNSRKESSFNLGTAEQKLLYTLHWILSDAADECSLQAEEEGKLDISTFAYLFPLSAITVTLNITINLKVVL